MATKVFSDNSGADFSGVPDARIFDYNPNSNDGSGEDLWITGFEHTVIRFNGLSDGSLSGSTAAGFIIKFVEPWDKEASEIVVEALATAFVESTVTWNNVGSGTVLGTFSYSGTGDINIAGAWLDAHVQDIFDGVVANNGYRIYTTEGYALTYSSQADDGDRPSMIGDVTTGGGSISATSNITLAALTSSATGVLSISGSLSRTLAALTTSSTAATSVSGNTNTTLAALTTAGTINLVDGGVSATLNTTLAPLTSSGNASLPITGGATVTLAPLSSSANANISIAGTSIITLSPLISSAQAQLTISGGLTCTLQPLTSNGAIGELLDWDGIPEINNLFMPDQFGLQLTKAQHALKVYPVKTGLNLRRLH